MRRNDFFLTVPGDPRLGLIVNLPAALRGGGVHELPPYAPVRASRVDRYPAAPAEWPRSTGSTASYFVPIVEGRGMWLDFNRCWDHPHHIAIVVSIQGVNPLTGRKADKLELERYPDDGTVEKWLRGRQNYLASTATPHGMLWIDGFRAKDGTVRQYVFTKEEGRGAAAQIIGVDRVFAIGAAFFLSKEPKPPPKDVPRGGMALYDGVVVPTSGGLHFGGSGDMPVNDVFYSSTLSTSDLARELRERPLMAFNMAAATLTSSFKETSPEVTRSVRKMSGKMSYSADLKGRCGSPEVCSALIAAAAGDWTVEDRLEIAAGAEIDQELYRDTVGPEFWQAKCAGVVAVSYAPAALVEQIFKGGEVPEPEGFLAELKVGNG